MKGYETALHKKEMENGAEHSGPERKINRTFRTANVSIEIRYKWKGVWTLPSVQAEFV